MRPPSRRPRHVPIVVVLTLAFLFAGAAPSSAETPEPMRATPRWIQRIDRLVSGHRVSVTIGDDGHFLYRHQATAPRIPASNEKLLLSMALFDRLGPSLKVSTLVSAETAPDADGVIDGDLWILGRGDPEVDRATMTALAKGVRAAGITQILGRVKGSTGYFARDWWAVGWKRNFRADEVPFPTALTFLGNTGPGGGHISDPERRAAVALTSRLRRMGIRVTGRPGAARPPNGLVPVASVDSDVLKDIVRRMDVDSLNFYAEVLGKLLARLTTGAPATIAHGAAAITAYEHDQGVDNMVHHDSSGLSYANRVRTNSIVRLLWAADDKPWGPVLRMTLPRRGQGTLEHRLHGLKVRAKTGTLDRVSALSGWVWLEDRDAWGEFSIVSLGLTKEAAVRIEDAIVRTVSANAG